MAGLCGVSDRRAPPSNVLPSLPSASDMFGASGENAETRRLRSQLELKVREIQTLRAELEAREREKDEVLVSHQQYHDIIEAQEAEMAQLRNGGAGGGWEQKFLKEEEARKAQEAKNAELAAENDKLKAVLEQKEGHIKSILRRTRADPNRMDDDDNEDGEGQEGNVGKLRDGPKGFFDRLQQMRAGATLQLWQKEKFVPTVFALSQDATQLTMAAGEKKKPFETLLVSDIVGITYPAKLQVKKAKKGGETGNDSMKFSLDMADHRVFVVQADSMKQLTTWFLGLQHLSAKPGEGLIPLGSFLWMKVRAKLRVDAARRGLSPHKVLSDEFLKLVQENAEEGEEEEEEEEGGEEGEGEAAEEGGEGNTGEGEEGGTGEAGQGAEDPANENGAQP